MRLSDRLDRMIDSAGGRISFSDFMRTALYERTEGYYSQNVVFGKKGDFMTAPRVHSSFGQTLARVILEEWERLGRPRDFAVIELGPGEDSVSLAAFGAPELRPEIVGSWKLYLCERGRRRIDTGHSPPPCVVEWIEPDANIGPLPGIVLANEVLDALPFRRLIRRGEGWRELGVARGPDPGHYLWKEGPLLAPLPPFPIPEGVAEGTVFEVAEGLPELLRWLAGVLRSGSVYFIDYGDSAENLLRRFPQGSLATYEGHVMGEDPLSHPGERDISAWVDFSRVASEAERAGFRSDGLETQAQFLHEHGLEEVVRRTESQDPVEGVRARLALKAFYFGYPDHRVLALRRTRRSRAERASSLTR